MEDLKNLSNDSDIKTEKDSLGGFSVQDSGIYKEALIEIAYISMANSKAMALNVHLKLAETGALVRQAFYFRSGEAKGCKNYYERNGEKHFLPGYNMANGLCRLTMDKLLKDVTTEEKVIKLYSHDAGGEVDTKVDMVTELIGTKITIGLLKQTVDKTKKSEATGDYEPTGETRDENEIDKMFHAGTGKTLAELEAKEEGLFIGKWEEKWKGQVKNKAKGTGKATGAGTADAPAQASGDAAPSLFK